jgi:predicted metal-dependent hydrolase
MSTKDILIVSGISVEVTRKRIKNLHLAVYPPNGRVTVSAPEPMSLEAIRAAVVIRLAWVKRNQEQMALALRQSPREMIDGETHYFLGQRYRMKVVEKSGPTSISVNNKSTMVLTCAYGASLASKRKALDSWYREQFNNVIPDIFEEWLDKFKLSNVTWRVRRMKTKWATVNVTKRVVSLNVELLKQNHDSVTAVIVHELSHFSARNHDASFIAAMDAQLPDWRGRISRLNNSLLSTENWKVSELNS